MPRSTVKTRYVKVERRRRPQKPSQALPKGVYEVGGIYIEMRTPAGKLSLLGQYIEENRESGLSVHELVEQFQEYDCEHAEREAVASHRRYTETICKGCGLVEKKFKPGESE